jgi:hypothetical protein
MCLAQRDGVLACSSPPLSENLARDVEGRRRARLLRPRCRSIARRAQPGSARALGKEHRQGTRRLRCRNQSEREQRFRDIVETAARRNSTACRLCGMSPAGRFIISGGCEPLHTHFRRNARQCATSARMQIETNCCRVVMSKLFAIAMSSRTPRGTFTKGLTSAGNPVLRDDNARAMPSVEPPQTAVLYVIQLTFDLMLCLGRSMRLQGFRPSLADAATSWPLPARAQLPAKIPRIRALQPAGQPPFPSASRSSR